MCDHDKCWSLMFFCSYCDVMMTIIDVWRTCCGATIELSKLLSYAYPSNKSRFIDRWEMTKIQKRGTFKYFSLAPHRLPVLLDPHEVKCKTSITTKLECWIQIRKQNIWFIDMAVILCKHQNVLPTRSGICIEKTTSNRDLNKSQNHSFFNLLMQICTVCICVCLLYFNRKMYF